MSILTVPRANPAVWLRQSVPMYVVRDVLTLLRHAGLRPTDTLARMYIKLARALTILHDEQHIVASIVALGPDLDSRDSIAFQLVYHGQAHALTCTQDMIIKLRDDLSKR